MFHSSRLSQLGEDNLFNQKEQKVDIPCFENPFHEATFHCAECEADFCERCFTEVHKPKVFTKHEGIPISEKPIKLPKCAQHSYNTAEFLCKHPNCTASVKIMCHTCLLAGEHRLHSYSLLMDHLRKNSNELEVFLKKFNVYIENQKKYQEKIKLEIESYDVNGQIYKSISDTVSKEFDEKKKEALDKLEKFAKDSFETRTELGEFLKEDLKNNEDLKKELESRLKLKNDLLDITEIKTKGEQCCDMIKFSEEPDLGMNNYNFALTARMKLKISMNELYSMEDPDN